MPAPLPGFGQLASGFGGLGGLAGGAAAPSSATSVSNPIDAKTQGITIAPVAVNFGELINSLVPGAVNGSSGGGPATSFPTFSGDGRSSVLSGLRTTSLNSDTQNNSTNQSKFSTAMILTALGIGGIVLVRKMA
jgi:hypothetical protein